MAKNWNLPLIHEQPFASIAEAREVAVVYTNPARDAVADRIHIRPVWQAEALATKQPRAEFATVVSGVN